MKLKTSIRPKINTAWTATVPASLFCTAKAAPSRPVSAWLLRNSKPRPALRTRLSQCGGGLNNGGSKGTGWKVPDVDLLLGYLLMYLLSLDVRIKTHHYECVLSFLRLQDFPEIFPVTLVLTNVGNFWWGRCSGGYNVEAFPAFCLPLSFQRILPLPGHLFGLGNAPGRKGVGEEEKILWDTARKIVLHYLEKRILEKL